MKKIMLCLIWLLPLFANAQKSNGVIFTDGLNWEQIKLKAQKENKLIFIDVYATWCGPCKMMDKEVYTEKEIGDLVNSRFIAVKLQMDSTKNDAPEVKMWYKDASAIQMKYKIAAFPTFLFFNSSGELVDRDLGYKNKIDFLALAQKAANPLDNYAGLLKQFNEGRLSESQLSNLAIDSKRKLEDSTAFRVARRYKKQFIDAKDPEKVLSPNLRDILSSFGELFSFDDPIIKFMYLNPKESDQLLNLWNGYSKAYTDYVVNRDWIISKIWPKGVAIGKEPVWEDLQQSLTANFDKTTAKRLVLKAKINWYHGRKDWNNAIKYEIENIDFNGIDTNGMGRLGVNNLVFDVIFKHSNDPFALKKGIEYMETILRFDPKNHAQIDTYSNVLYKAGYKQKAIVQEEKALALAKAVKDKESIQIYVETIKKMRQNKPTWN